MFQLHSLQTMIDWSMWVFVYWFELWVVIFCTACHLHQMEKLTGAENRFNMNLKVVLGHNWLDFPSTGILIACPVDSKSRSIFSAEGYWLGGWGHFMIFWVDCCGWEQQCCFLFASLWDILTFATYILTFWFLKSII